MNAMLVQLLLKETKRKIKAYQRDIDSYDKEYSRDDDVEYINIIKQFIVINELFRKILTMIIWNKELGIYEHNDHFKTLSKTISEMYSDFDYYNMDACKTILTNREVMFLLNNKKTINKLYELKGVMGCGMQSLLYT